MGRPTPLAEALLIEICAPTELATRDVSGMCLRRAPYLGDDEEVGHLGERELPRHKRETPRLGQPGGFFTSRLKRGRSHGEPSLLWSGVGESCPPGRRLEFKADPRFSARAGCSTR